MTAWTREVRTSGDATLTVSAAGRSMLTFTTWSGVRWAIELQPCEVGSLMLAGRALLDGAGVPSPGAPELISAPSPGQRP